MNPFKIVLTASFFFYFGWMMRQMLIPLYAKHSGASVEAAGLVVSSMMLVTCFLAPVLGLFSDSLGRKHVIVLGLMMGAVSTAIFGSVRELWLMIVISMIFGLSDAAFAPTAHAIVGDITQAKQLGRSYGLFHTVLQLGQFVGPFVGGFFILLYGYFNSFILAGVIFSLGFMVALKLPRGTRIRSSKKLDFKKTIKILWHNKLILISYGSVFSLTFGWGVIYTFLPLYGLSIGLSTAIIGMVLTAQPIANIIVRGPIGEISDRVGRRLLFLSMAIPIAVIAIAFLGFFTHVAILMTLMVLVGLGSGVTLTLGSAIIAKETSQETRGIAMGIHVGALHGGMGLSPAIIGLVISRYGFQYGFHAAAIPGCLVSLLMIAMMRKGIIHD
jgi:MFS family permease